MLFNKEVSQKIASCLLKAEAVKLSPENPFTWASGIKSPIYCDNRVLLSFPEYRAEIVDRFCNLIRQEYPKCEGIAAVATGAIAIASIVADKLNIPMVYIRPEPKKHGMGNQIEGKLLDVNYVIIEDLISTGGSSLKAFLAMQQVNAKILGMAAIFSYGFKLAEENFLKSNCNLFTLSNYESLVELAIEENYISDKHLQTLREWRSNPESWGK